jgi:hypothetical protein
VQDESRACECIRGVNLDCISFSVDSPVCSLRLTVKLWYTPNFSTARWQTVALLITRDNPANSYEAERTVYMTDT